MHRTARNIALATAGGALASLALGTVALAATHHPGERSDHPVMITVFSPGSGDLSGSHGVGFIVDLDAQLRPPDCADGRAGQWVKVWSTIGA